jgi:predicted TIM-barrel fold metal-dependent hydrolase
MEACISNDDVAAYVAQYPDRLIGFAGVDPSAPQEAIAEMDRARDELSMHGLAVAPAAQDFHPSDSQAMLVYSAAAERQLPVVFHTGVHVASATKLEYARPVLLDEVARELPDLKMVIAHLGHPWELETIPLLAKHANVFAETSWLLREPWRAYQALLSAHQCGVIDKLLFGSGFPGAAASCCIEALYSINHLVHGTNLPTIPREQLRGIVERDALSLLGIADGHSRPPLQHASAIIDDEADEA